MTLLKVENMKTHFLLQKSWRPFVAERILKAVDGVSFSIAHGEILGLVGESGCGKSTVGRTLTRLENATAGSANMLGNDILKLSRAEFHPYRRHLQMIFQDPFASLNPRLTIEQTLAEPLRIHGITQSHSESRKKIIEMLSDVGISSHAIKRYPHEFSGGQRQRIGIARVMLLSPSLVIADEPLSALDVSIQAQVLTLIKQIQKAHDVAMLFISHDLGVVRYISDRVAVMYLGHIVEVGRKSDLFATAVHPYTRLLLQSIPHPDPLKPRRSASAIGEPANAVNPPAGCVFHPRCSLTTDICRQQMPPFIRISREHKCACHHAHQLIQRNKT